MSSVGSMSPPSNSGMVRFKRRDTISIGSDGTLSPPVQNSVHFSHEKRSRPRTRTTLRFAHPPRKPKSMRRLVRPRVLLQLHQVSERGRPYPALDVLPSTILAPRLAKKFPRVLNGRDGLGPHDLVIVSSDSYDSNLAGSDASGSEDDWESREVVATICQLPKQEGGAWGKAEICLNHGSSWECTPLPNGSYEFTTTLPNGEIETARWVLRGRQQQRSSSMSQVTISQPEEKRFTFSIINKNSRRHPIIASMTDLGLEIMDQYSSATSSPAIDVSETRPSPSAPAGTYFDTSDNETGDSNVVQTDEHIRSLIVLTGIWIVFREGWSDTFSYENAMSSAMRPSLLNSRRRVPLGINTSPAIDTTNVQLSPTVASPTSPMTSPPLMARRISSRFTGKAVRQHPDADSTSSGGTELRMRHTRSVGAAYLEKANQRNANATKNHSGHKSIGEDNLADASGCSHPSRNTSRLCRKKVRADNDNKPQARAADGTCSLQHEDECGSQENSTEDGSNTGDGLEENVASNMINQPRPPSWNRTPTPSGKTVSEKSSKRSSRRWSSLRHLAHVVSCR